MTTFGEKVQDVRMQLASAFSFCTALSILTVIDSIMDTKDIDHAPLWKRVLRLVIVATMWILSQYVMIY